MTYFITYFHLTSYVYITRIVIKSKRHLGGTLHHSKSYHLQYTEYSDMAQKTKRLNSSIRYVLYNPMHCFI